MVRILSIDGGGIRGIIPGEILVALENKLKDKTGNKKARIPDYFDLIAGTSTGGILTCTMLYPDKKNPERPLYDANDAVKMYIKKGDDIFDPKSFGILNEKYPSSGIEKVLNKYFPDYNLSDLLKPCIITSYDIENQKPKFFKQLKAAADNADNFRIKDVARATSAAPTFFEAAYIQSLTGTYFSLIDGGVIVNNPAVCAYAEASRLFKCEPENTVIVSLGAGAEKEKGLSYNKVKNWGGLQWIKPLIEIMMSGSEVTANYQMTEFFTATSNYFRINPSLGKASTAMDNAKKRNIKALVEAGRKGAKTYDLELDKIVELTTRQSVKKEGLPISHSPENIV